jgi:hypothetical protein
MANKNKKTKEPYLLNDDEHIGEVEKRTIAIYDKKKDKPEDIIKALKRAKETDVQFNDDDTISVKEDRVSKDIKKPSRIIKVESFKKVVNNFNKINLSESDIITILEKSQNPIMKKSELVESIKNNLISEARMNDDVRRKFESGETDYNDILGQELTNQLAQEAFQEISDNIRRKTGKQNVSLNDVQQLLGNSLLAAAKEEYRIGIESLERKAVDMIRKQYNIPVDAVEFEATIVGLPPQMLVGRDMSPQEMEQLSRQVGIKVGKINREGLKMEKGNTQPPEGKTHEEFKPQIKRRRFTNAMMHGAARKSQNLHHLDDQLREENPELGRNYANLMAANDANYFLIDDETIKREGESGIHAGNVRVSLSNPQKPKIIAQGMVFPILLHELSKGVVELMSLWSLPQDKDVRQYVLDKTDNLESETNDIRLGAKIWEKFVAQIPMDNQEVISLTWNMLQELPDNEFNSIIEGLIQNRTEAQQKVRRMADEALEELQREASEDAFGGYEDSPGDEEEDDVATPSDEDEEEEDDILQGILRGQETDDYEPDYESMSKRDLELAIDHALDAGDMKLVKYLGSILNRK